MSTFARVLAMLPPYAQDSTHVQRVFVAMANEIDRLDQAAADVRDTAWPQLADDHLELWEAFLGLAVNPADKTLAQRRNTALAYLAKIASSGSGLDWEAALTQLIGTGWSYEEYLPPSRRATNDLTNPDFETNTTGWSQSNTSGLTTAPTANRTNVGPTPGDGAWMVRQQGQNAADGATRSIYLLTPVGTAGYAVTPGDTVTFSMWVNIVDSPSGGVAARIQWYKADGSAASVPLTAGAFTTTPGAQRIFVTAVVPADAAFAAPRSFGSTAAANDTFDYYVDAMRFSKGTDTAYKSGDSAGWEWLGTAHASKSREAEAVPPYSLRITLPFSGAIAEPAAPATAPASGGGTIPAGTYRYVVTATNAYGETLASAQTPATLGATGHVVVSWAAVSGATGYRVYRSAAGAPVGGPYSLVAIVAGGSTVTYDDTAPATIGGGPPPANTTASVQANEAETLARQITPANLDLIFGYGVGFIVGTSQVGEEFL